MSEAPYTFLTQDGGVQKQILKQGTGSKCPAEGITVNVHYVGTLEDGTKFDSSRDRGQYFHFEIGGGRVIKGWDIALRTMRLGELANVKITSDYGYGDQGAGDFIPGGATLIFEVELVEFDNRVDISVGSDGSLLKEVIKACKEDDKKIASPLYEGIVSVSYEMVEGTGEDKVNKQSFTIGEGELVAGVEAALRKMKLGEESEVTISDKHLMVPEDSADEVSDDKRVYRVTLHDIQPCTAMHEMDDEDKVNAAMERKEQGNEHFKAGKFLLAIKKYDRALTFLKRILIDQTEPIQELLLSLHTNLAVCRYKAKEYLEGVKSADEVYLYHQSNIRQSKSIQLILKHTTSKPYVSLN